MIEEEFDRNSNKFVDAECMELEKLFVSFEQNMARFNVDFCRDRDTIKIP